jgi:hypothetical protein
MASNPKLPVPFEPVPVRPRHDGWTAERQIAFIEKLADCGSVSAAATHVAMSRESARDHGVNFVTFVGIGAGSTTQLRCARALKLRRPGLAR